MNKYLYIIKLLPLIDANKKFFLETIAPNPNNLHYFLSIDAPRIICKTFEEPLEEVPVKNITADLKQNSDHTVLFVEFSDNWPQEDTHCYAIAIAISPNNDIRLFTYEKGKNHAESNGGEAYYVGEFLLDGSHINYGTTSEKRISLFSGVIMSVLNQANK